MTKTACVLLAHGTEEMEAVIVIDILRRGGIEVVAATINADSDRIICSQNTVLVADKFLKDVKDTIFDLVVLPGGADGAINFSNDQTVGAFLKAHQEANKVVSAICASPTALAAHKIRATKITTYPCEPFQSQIKESGYTYVEDDVVVDGNVVTSRGPFTAFKFALKLVEIVVDYDTAKKISSQMLTTYYV